MVSALVLGPFGPDQGPDLALTWDLDLSLTTVMSQLMYREQLRIMMITYVTIA